MANVFEIGDVIQCRAVGTYEGDTDENVWTFSVQGEMPDGTYPNPKYVIDLMNVVMYNFYETTLKPILPTTWRLRLFDWRVITSVRPPGTTKPIVIWRQFSYPNIVGDESPDLYLPGVNAVSIRLGAFSPPDPISGGKRFGPVRETDVDGNELSTEGRTTWGEVRDAMFGGLNEDLVARVPTLNMIVLSVPHLVRYTDGTGIAIAGPVNQAGLHLSVRTQRTRQPRMFGA